MKSYLVIGLESSCTKLVSKFMALNLKIIDSISDWDGREHISSEYFSVTHRSLPHGAVTRNRKIIDLNYCNNFDVVVVSTRDLSCVLQSKINNHQKNKELAIKENLESIDSLKNILSGHKESFIFSYETALLLQDCYTEIFLKSLGIKKTVHVNFNNVNEKYLVGGKNG